MNYYCSWSFIFHARVFDGDVILLFFRVLVFPIISYYIFCFLQEVGAENKIQHHYVNSNARTNEKGIGATRNIVHASVITNVSQNDLNVNGCFIIMDMFTLISKVFGFDVAIQENTMV